MAPRVQTPISCKSQKIPLSIEALGWTLQKGHQIIIGTHSWVLHKAPPRMVQALLRWAAIACVIGLVGVFTLKAVIVWKAMKYEVPAPQLNYSYVNLNKFGNDTSGCPTEPNDFVRVRRLDTCFTLFTDLLIDSTKYYAV